ncbi:MAG TPA: hypothetical protein PLX08_07155 [Bacteroidales bacterium]|jgi:NRPS condensation-like uncharacterized protein|nr:hypothetical protein [Bacteroidales bacterium]
MSKDLTLVFRLTAVLKEPVRYQSLKEAVEITSRRFPYFSVSLGSGFFWHFLELNDLPPRIQAEEEIPCRAFATGRKNEVLYRILAKGKRISVEFIHILTDGSGAMEYLKSLLYTYFKIAGKQISETGDIMLPETEITEEEYEDGYNKFFQKLPAPEKLLKAWHLPFRLNEKPRLRTINAEVSVKEMLNVSRRYKVSLTEYFVSVYHYSLQEIFVSSRKNSRKKIRKVLRVQVPVNMRNKLPARTMRNFSLFVMPEIDLRLGTFTFDEILRAVHHQLQLSSDIKQISRFLSSNVSYEKLFLVRILPLFIKKMAIAAIYKGLGSKRLTGTFTNLGSVSLPSEMEDLIDYFNLIPPPPNTSVKVSAGVISYKDKLVVCFSNISRSRELERLILGHFIKDGIHVKILNNN